MKIATGHGTLDNMKLIDASGVRFITDDGRIMFEVRICSDGRSIEVRGVDSCRVDGVLYGSAIDIRPRVANCVEIRPRVYEDQ